MTDNRRQPLRRRANERTVEQRQHAPADAAPELYEPPRRTERRPTSERPPANAEER